MKNKIAFAVAAMVAGGSAQAADLLAIPDFEETYAAPTVVGSASLWLGAAVIDTEDDNFDSSVAFNFGGDAKAVWIRPESHSLQFEVQGRAGFPYDKADEDSELTYFATALHGFYHTGNDRAYGAYISLYGGPQVDESDSTMYLGGAIEGAHFKDAGTLYMQAGGGHVINANAEGAAAHAFGRLGWRHFVSETSKVEFDGLLGYAWGTADDDEPDGIYANWGVEYEHQYAGTPLSGFIAYRGYLADEHEADDEDGTSIVEHVLKAGATLSWGGTPKAIDHYAPFDVADHSSLLFWDDL